MELTASFVVPILRGDNVTVRPIAANDWEGMYAVASDPLVWEQHPAANRYKEAEFRKYFDDAVACGSAVTIVDERTGKIIGSSRYHEFDPDKSEIEIGWTFLGRDFWGGVYNREVKLLMLDHALRFVDTIIFWVGESNLRSRRAMEKIGGVLRGGVHTRPLSGNDPYVIYEMKRDQCESLRRP